MLKKISFFLVLILSIFSYNFSAANISIIAFIDDEIITNHDLNKEKEYLKILNPQLNQLNENQISKIAKNSLINEIIKKKEVEKFIDLQIQNQFVENQLNVFLKRLKLLNEQQFEDKYSSKTYNINELKKKLNLELFWNELIYNKYINQVKINENEILKKVELINRKTKKYFIYEISFNKNKDISDKELFNQINTSINEIGFENTANIFSISETAKYGGQVGWVNENTLSKKIQKEMKTMKIDDISNPIEFGNSYIIFKITDIKIENFEINKEKELNNLIQIETEKQLKQFSKIYFDKAKINYTINEK